ncbi:MAG: serine/threonine protein kinase [Catenulispora sp.]|nr:serine/threonine protein kinase [Catenulispora sp.]
MEQLDHGDPRTVGSYTVSARLGVGTTGTVYLARSATGRPVALKVVHPALTEDETFPLRLQAAFTAARHVSWMSTTPVLDADPNARPPWVATAFVAGVPLSRAVEQCGPLPEPVLIALVRELAVALLTVHGAGTVHRGVAPAKVLLAADRPHLLERSVVAQAALGATPPAAFLAPEQTQARSVTAAADMFSLGSTIYYAATGRAPFGGPADELPTRIAKASPVLGFLPPGLAELIGACLAKDPNARATARQVLDFVQQRAPAPLAEGWMPPALSAEIAAQTLAG